ncbi:extensin-like domain-containing protein [Rhodoplanes sp. Z2-YC6860]|uniref:extensin-like domain-containing protein n=1 Tax=Rhodoplanes sp. Z2-YC6860 TaxID=674703 RepID=UPI00078DCE19|nr:extensin family protein [Rhodoplanes sp. Z2-YC6860]AMN41056.1 extensin-like protein [Rhodoplanes sp. Z2-YC6860]
MSIKSGRKWLLSVFAVPVAFAGVATADPWLEKSPTAGRGWDDIPFLGPPQRQTKQRPPRGPSAARALEAKREMQRELRRMPETDRAANAKASANVFPPPRVPQQAKTAEPPPETSSTATPVAARDAKPSEIPHKPSRTAAAPTRDAERELQRQLDRTLPPAAVTPVPEQLACAERLAKIARYSPLPNRSGPGACGATDLVRLDSILMPDRSVVALNPAPQIQCSMAEQVAEWVREDVGPAASTALGSPLMSINDYDAYDCRPRNNVKGAKLSEHGKGNALDVGSFRLRNGGVFTLADQLVTKQFRDKVRLAACSRFMTVLGPGADPYHGDHVHLDMAERSHNTKICQWNVRETLIAAQSEPEPSQRTTASAPPAAAAPVMPPSKVEAKVEPKIDPKIESKSEPKNEPQAPAVAAAPKVEPPVIAEPPMPRPKPPEVAEAPVKSAAEAPPPQVKDERPTEELSRDQASQDKPKDERPPKFDVAAATPKEPEARPERKDEASPSLASEALQLSTVSPPLPRRKPEALQRLAEIQQPETPNRSERGTRGERSRHYDPRRRFERDVRRFMRNFF